MGDFNLSRYLGRDHFLQSNQEINPRWCAPEAIRESRYSKEADVYSFGIVLWELLTWQEPWEGPSASTTTPSVHGGSSGIGGSSVPGVLLQQPERSVNAFQVMTMVEGGKRPVVPRAEELPGVLPENPEALDRYVKLMRACWDQSPERRPKFEEVIQELRQIVGLSRPGARAAAAGGEGVGGRVAGQAPGGRAVRHRVPSDGGLASGARAGENSSEQMPPRSKSEAGVGPAIGNLIDLDDESPVLPLSSAAAVAATPIPISKKAGLRFAESSVRTGSVAASPPLPVSAALPPVGMPNRGWAANPRMSPFAAAANQERSVVAGVVLPPAVPTGLGAAVVAAASGSNGNVGAGRSSSSGAIGNMGGSLADQAERSGNSGNREKAGLQAALLDPLVSQVELVGPAVPGAGVEQPPAAAAVGSSQNLLGAEGMAGGQAAAAEAESAAAAVAGVAVPRKVSQPAYSPFAAIQDEVAPFSSVDSSLRATSSSSYCMAGSQQPQDLLLFSSGNATSGGLSFFSAGEVGHLNGGGAIGAGSQAAAVAEVAVRGTSSPGGASASGVPAGTGAVGGITNVLEMDLLGDEVSPSPAVHVTSPEAAAVATWGNPWNAGRGGSSSWVGGPVPVQQQLHHHHPQHYQQQQQQQYVPFGGLPFTQQGQQQQQQYVQHCLSAGNPFLEPS